MSSSSQQAVQLTLNSISGSAISRVGGKTRSIRREGKLDRLVSPDGLALAASSSGVDATTLSQFNRFALQNLDLLSIIDQSQALLRRAESSHFSSREDLQNILIDEVVSKLPTDTPLDSAFLKRNQDITSVLALNVGGILDRVAEDSSIAEDLADGQTIQVAIRRLIAEEAATQTGEPKGLDSDFFQANPLAAAYLLDHPSEMTRIAEDDTSDSVDEFLTRYNFTRTVIRDEVANKASHLLDNSATYPLSFLQQDDGFSSLLVGASHLSGHENLPSFLRTERTLSLERIDEGALMRAYEAHRASSYLPTGSVVDEDFLKNNVGLALVLTRHEEARTAFVGDLSRLDALEAPASASTRLSNANRLLKAYGEAAQNTTLRVNGYF